ncbi:MAG: flagellar hook-associated protein FlgK [Planctomycetota bacterium]
MSSLLIGLSGLAAHSRAMEVTAHNIANAATDGYSRQRAEVGTMTPQSVSPGQLGRGVKVDAITSYRDALVTERLRSVAGASGRLGELEKTLGETEMIFNEPNETGFSNVLNRLFSSLENLTNNADSSALRGATIQQMETVTATMNSLSVQLHSQHQGLHASMETQADEANALIDRVVDLNSSIRRESQALRNPNDLIDERDRVLRQLSGYIDVTVRENPLDRAMYVESRGRLLVGIDSGQHLAVQKQEDDSTRLVLAESGEALTPTNGSLAGLEEMSRHILPTYMDRLDTLAGGLIAEFNTRHAVGTSHLMQVGTHVSQVVIDSARIGLDLDDPEMLLTGSNNVGIPEPLRPVFTDATGADRSTNLTINVHDPETGIAEKYILRYEPGSTGVPASRSLSDLVAAINSGRGGGFSVHPPVAGGVGGLEASLVSTKDGTGLKLQADAGLTVDFSRALDTRPAATAWTSSDVTVSGNDAALSNARLVFEVAGGNLEAYTLDPTSGVQVPFGSVAVGAVGTIGGITIDASGGTYREGERFAVDFDHGGNVAGGSHTSTATWQAGDAGFTVKGRYGGNHAYDPAQPWSMQVLQAGDIGSDTNPPVVEFTYFTGPDDARVEEKAIHTLDGSYPPGSQVPVGEGVYVEFDAGGLTPSSTAQPIVVDGQSDQAQLLGALGINAMFSGTDARTMAVSRSLREDPARLAVGHTRAAGDNSNLLAIAGVRDLDDFADTGVSFDDHYQQTVADVAIRIDQVSGLKDNQDAVAQSLESRRDAIAGVNIDEEVGLMILQQQAYSASARLVSIARDNIRTLLDALS